jgi:LacI family transcriptional regulator
MHGTTDGALLILPEETNDELENLVNHGYRFVVVDPLHPLNERIPAVSAANSSGANQAVRHLLDLGHRRIGALMGPIDWLAPQERRDGYHAALASAGIMPDPALEIASTFLVAGGVEAGGRLLDLAEPPTAIFAFNDELAVGAMQAARARGLRIPEDLSIVGFDDVEWTRYVTPQLTTVRQPLAEMGRMAVSLLTRLVDNQSIEVLHVELATRFIVRGSTQRLET